MSRMTIEEFAALTDRFGSRLADWPRRHQAGARALAQDSQKARQMLAEAERLEALFAGANAATTPTPVPDALMQRILADAAMVAAQNAPKPARRPVEAPKKAGFWDWLQNGYGLMSGGALAASLVIGIYTGSTALSGVWPGESASLPRSEITGSFVDIALADEDEELFLFGEVL